MQRRTCCDEDTRNIGGALAPGLHPVGQASALRPGQGELSAAFLPWEDLALFPVVPRSPPSEHGESAVQ